MKSRFILFKRAGVYYSEDATTRKQHIFCEAREHETVRLIRPKNQPTLLSRNEVSML